MTVSRLVKQSHPGTVIGGLLDPVDKALVGAARLPVGRNGEPTAGIIDSQSVKTNGSGGGRGCDAGKKIKGRKRIS